MGSEGDRGVHRGKDPGVLLAAIKALTDKGNEIDFAALRGLIKVMSS